tara:strand:- start:713 stop:1393 length:681 start_codon:yes stop_codon:yes gene_type:complete
MKKYFYLFIIFLVSSNAFADTDNYKSISKIEMDVLRNGEKIGFSNYIFKYEDDEMEVKNKTEFEVKLLGVNLLSIKSNSIEKYKKNKLLYFNSKTTQNKKNKFVKLELNEDTNKFIINGSSFKGETDTDKVIGNWWNENILSANSQISPLSGSIKEQVVKLIKKEIITINGKSYETLKFQLKSKNQDLPEDKKLDFEIWLDIKKRFLVKISYERMGKWEYIINNYK